MQVEVTTTREGSSTLRFQLLSAPRSMRTSRSSLWTCQRWRLRNSEHSPRGCVQLTLPTWRRCCRGSPQTSDADIARLAQDKFELVAKGRERTESIASTAQLKDMAYTYDTVVPGLFPGAPSYRQTLWLSSGNGSNP